MEVELTSGLNAYVGSRGTVFLVDDDARVLNALSRLLTAHGRDVRTFRSAEEFLTEHDPEIPGCAVLDIAMSCLDGLVLQRVLGVTGDQRPIILIHDQRDVQARERHESRRRGFSYQSPSRQSMRWGVMYPPPIRCVLA